MTVIITEGAEGKSQHMFWKWINKAIYKDQLRLVCCNGIKNVKNIIYREYFISKTISLKDAVVLDLDEVADNYAVAYKLEELYDMINGDCPWEYGGKQLGSFKLPNITKLGFICFEDVLLRIPELYNMIYSNYDKENNERNIKIYELIKEYISLNDWGESNRLTALANRLFGNDNLASAENIAYQLLREMTNNRKAQFQINKAGMGNCYFVNCGSDACFCKMLKQRSGSMTRERACGLYYRHDRMAPRFWARKALEIYRSEYFINKIKKCKEEFKLLGIKDDLVL